MECLTPRLREIPAGSWYCRLCANHRSAENVSNDDPTAINAGDDEIESESETPRIIRTRATERIRAAIITRGELFSSESEEEETPAQPQPGPSRVRSTLDRVRRALKRVTRKRRRRRATRRTTRSTNIEEYDVNSGDEKFPIRRSTRGRVVKRKRKTKKRRTKKKSSTSKQSCAFTMPRGTNFGVNAMRYSAGIPTVRLFEPANNLEYFSDDGNDEIEIEPTPVHRINASLDVLTAMRSNYRVGTNRNLLKRKLIEPTTAPVNILDSIMESQEKWHSKNRLSDTCVLMHGRPVFNKNVKNNIPQVTHAPLNGTNNAPVNLGTNNFVTESRGGEHVDANHGTTTENTTNNSENVSGGGSNNNEETTGRSVVNTFTPLPQRPQKTAASRKSFDIFGDNDENKSCPNFSVYSSESMDVANKKKKEEESDDAENNGDTSDERVDLVQLSGDEDEEEKEKENPTENPIDTQAKSQVLHLYDSDGGLDEELNKHFEGQLNPENYQEPDRSYTPCLDEKYPNKEGEDGIETEKSNVGIDGMDTELISEEEDSNLSGGRDVDKNIENNKDSDKNKQGNVVTTPFKKVQNQRDRNYRDKDKNKHRHSRDRSEDKENKSKKQTNKKREIPRYNVREVITKASQRDPFGRTKPRERSRSQSLGLRRRSRSPRTKSRSRSRSWSRKSFTISRSPSYSPRPHDKRPTRTRSPSPKRRFRSKSPVVRRGARAIVGRRSFSRSPSRPLHRSKSPFRRKETGKRKEKERKKKKNRSKDRKKRVQESR